MNPADVLLPDGATEFAQAAERWAQARYPLPVHRDLARESDGTIARRLWAEIADMGWTSVLVPQEHSGLGGDLVQACGIAHACGRSLLALHWLEHAVLAASVLLACPQGAARDAALAAMGKQQFALSALEPGKRSLLRPPSCTAREEAGGWRVVGQKTGFAAGAERLLVTALVDTGEPTRHSHLADRHSRSPTRHSRESGNPDRPSTTWLLLDVAAASPGVAIQETRGLDAHRTAQVHLDTVVPTSRVLAQGNAVLDALATAQDTAALAACAEACGLASMALERTLGHLTTRVQFGQPIGRFQVLQHRAADMFVALRYAAAMTWGTLEAVVAGSADAGAVAACKAEVMRQCRLVLAGATQLHGGMGVVDEMPISHAAKRLQVLESSYGDRTARLEQVAAQLA